MIGNSWAITHFFTTDALQICCGNEIGCNRRLQSSLLLRGYSTGGHGIKVEETAKTRT